MAAKKSLNKQMSKPATERVFYCLKLHAAEASAIIRAVFDITLDTVIKLEC